MLLKMLSEKAARRIFLIGYAYIGFMSSELFVDQKPPIIGSQTQLEHLLEIEKERLSCNKDIKAGLIGPLDSFFSGQASLLDDGKYKVTIKAGSGISTLRH